jgi:hypothetical protein
MNSLVIHRMGFEANHPLTTKLHNFIIEYESHEPMLENHTPPPPTLKAHVPALIVRWVQLQISRWIDRQLLTPTAIPTPTLSTLFDSMFVGEHRVPTLPEAYWSPAPSLPQQQMQQVQLPPLYGGAPHVQPAVTAEMADTRLTNEHFNSIFQAFWDMPEIKTRQVYQRAQTAGISLPTRSSNGCERCLACHLKGMCNSRCGRAYDHTIPSAPLPLPADSNDGAKRTGMSDWQAGSIRSRACL